MRARPSQALVDELARVREENGALVRATESRSSIDVAKGVLVARLGCTAEQAFALLRAQSQYENVKVRDIAAEIVAHAEAQAQPAG